MPHFLRVYVQSFLCCAGIDPNPDNFVCAGIIHTRSVQIGVLLRLEPNKQAEVNIFSSLHNFSFGRRISFLTNLSLLSTHNVSFCLLSDVPADNEVKQGVCVPVHLWRPLWTVLVLFERTLGFLTHQWLDFSLAMGTWISLPVTADDMW